MKSMARDGFSCSSEKRYDEPSSFRPGASCCRPAFASLTRCLTSKSLPSDSHPQRRGLCPAGLSFFHGTRPKHKSFSGRLRYRCAASCSGCLLSIKQIGSLSHLYIDYIRVLCDSPDRGEFHRPKLACLKQNQILARGFLTSQPKKNRLPQNRTVFAQLLFPF